MMIYGIDNDFTIPCDTLPDFRSAVPMSYSETSQILSPFLAIPLIPSFNVHTFLFVSCYTNVCFPTAHRYANVVPDAQHVRAACVENQTCHAL